MSEDSYSLQSRFINGSLYYRFSYWDESKGERRDIYADTFSKLTKKVLRAGFNIANQKSQLRAV